MGRHFLFCRSDAKTQHKDATVAAFCCMSGVDFEQNGSNGTKRWLKRGMQAEEGTKMFAKKLGVLAALVVLGGCHCGSNYRDAGYGVTPDCSTCAVPTQEKSFVDRHPLLSSPRNYYRDSGDSPVVKVLAGTF